jgi:hypothetical protein
VYIRLHHVPERLKDQSVTLDRPRVQKPFSDDSNTKVAFPFFCTEMASVQMTLVGDF